MLQAMSRFRGIRWDPGDPRVCSFWLVFETPIGLERFAISDERPLSDLGVRTFKNTMFFMTLPSWTFKNTRFLIGLLMLNVILGPKLRPLSDLSAL